MEKNYYTSSCVTAGSVHLCDDLQRAIDINEGITGLVQMIEAIRTKKNKPLIL